MIVTDSLSLDSVMNEMIDLCEIRGEMDEHTNQNIEKRVAYLQDLMNNMTTESL